MQKFSFIIDTNEYAGNFSRELTAYVTGMEDEHMEGNFSEAKEFAREYGLKKENYGEDNPFFDYAEMRIHDEYGYVYSGIDHAPGSKKCNSVEIYFGQKPPPHLLEVMKERAQTFAKRKKFKISGFRWETSITTTVDEPI